MKLPTAFSLFTILFFCTPTYADIDDDDWQNYLSNSCQVTIRGQTKKLLGELRFWSHVTVSMDSWANNMRVYKPEEDCQIQYTTTKNIIRYQQCMAFYQEKWQWFSRCRPIAVNACRLVGGYCQ